jgi:hypothetical protein
MRPLLACLLLALSLPATAQIYSYTDANGNQVFTNEPPQGSDAQAVQLNPTNTISSQPSSSTDNSNVTPNDNGTSAPFSELQLTGLPSDEALRANNGSFSVGVSSTPALTQGQQVQLILDGQAYGQPSSNPPLQLNNIPRGEHTLAVQVLSGGQSIQQSSAISFTIQRVALGTPKPSPRK